MEKQIITHSIKIFSRLFLAGILILPNGVHAELQKMMMNYPTSSSVATAGLKDKKFEKLKELENSKKWSLCSDQARGQFSTPHLVKVQGWVMATWLKCYRKKLEEESKFQSQEIQKYFQPLLAFEKSKESLLLSVARENILTESQKIRLFLADKLIEKMKSEKKVTLEDKNISWNNLDTLLRQTEKQDKEVRAKIYFYFSELAILQHDLNAGKQFLLQSLVEKETKQSKEKLNSVLLALGEVAQGKQSKVTEVTKIESIATDDELKAEDRLSQISKDKDYLSYLEQGIQYLNRYPNGRIAKVVQDQIFDFYFALLDKSVSLTETSADFEKYEVLKKSALDKMEKLDPIRSLEWARTFHRRNDFVGSLRLIEKALPSLQSSSSSAVAFYVAGRSAQFLGLYDRAQDYFEKYLEKNSGHEDVPEVMFRLGLVQARKGQWASAIAVFEKLLQIESSDKYELGSRYWIVRLLQKQLEGQSSKLEVENRIQAQTKALTDKFPLSYYGIRLQSEKMGNEFYFEKNQTSPQAISASFYLSPFQLQILKNVQFLSANGWLQEAQKEIAFLSLPQDATVKILFAQQLANAKIYPMLIKLANEAGDKNAQYRASDLIQVGFPEEHKNEIEKEAKKNSLNPILVKSLIRQESGFSPFAVSSSNAMGLMQMIPPTALEIAQDLKLGKIDLPDTMFNPEVNIQMGTYYLARMIRQYGGVVPMGLAAYNAGPHRLKSFVMARPEVSRLLQQHTSDPFDEIWFDELPWNETSFYVKAILRNTLIYKTFELKKINLEGILWKDLTTISVGGAQISTKSPTNSPANRPVIPVSSPRVPVNSPANSLKL